MATSPIDLAVGGAGQLGKSFRIVGVLPGATLVFFLYVLGATHPLSGKPNLAALGHSFSDISLTELGLLLFAALIVGFVLQPLQFAGVQLLEGYWGVGPFGEAARSTRIEQYSRKRLNLIDREDDLKREARAVTGDKERVLHAKIDEVARIRARFPEDPKRVMPTRLGNMLRRHEDLAGSQYGLDALVVIPHLALIAPKPHLDYLDDRRNELDVAVRFCLVWSICAVFALAVLWPDGFWALFAVAPWALAWLSYRGAVEAAGHYGLALSVIIDLNRFRLYEQLSIPMPLDTIDERARNVKLMALLDHRSTVSLRYSTSSSLTILTRDSDDG